MNTTPRWISVIGGAVLTALALEASSATPTTPAAAPAASSAKPVASGATLALNTSATKVILRAAAAQGGKGIEVRLRWTFQDGWLPDGGFNLYRSDGTGPVNSSPLGGTLASNAPAQIQIGANHTLQLRSLVSKATASQGTALPSLTTSVPRAASAASQFTQLAGQARQLHYIPAQNAAGSANAAVGAISSGAKAAPRAAVPAPSLADTVIAARRTLLLAAALNPDAGAALGLQFDDSTVTAGRSYTYTLRQVVGGKESTDIASVAVTVPTSATGLKPSAPTAVQAAQLGADSVGLRWDRLSAFTEQLMGVARYDIYRNSLPDTTAGFPPATNSGLGRKLNDIPVLVTDNVPAGSAGAAANGGGGGTSATTEAATFFNDTSPPLGSVTYTVTVTDIYGRSSDPAQVVFAVQDWHKPLPVPFASAQLQPNPAAAAQATSFKQARSQQYRRAKPFFNTPLTIQPPAQQILVAWTPSFQDPRLNNIWESNRPADPGVVYNVYRVDTEQPSATPTLLTSTPISSAPIPATQLPAGQANDALANQACLNIAGNSTTLQGACTNLNDDFRHTLLSAMYVYTFADSGVSKDHYYRYFVAAVFTKNSQEATPTRTAVVAYPNLTPPVAPTNLTTTFQSAATTAAATTTNNCGKLSLATTCHPLALPVSDNKPLTLTDWKGPIVKGSPRDMGGTMVVKWTASNDAARYEVYRANALHNKAPNMTVCSWFTCQSMVAVDWQALRDPDGTSSATGASGPALADSDFALLGTTTSPEYDDQLSRSSAHYYVYRVVPVNRWNVPGPLISVSARAPATMNPTPAKLLAGTPAPDGGAQAEFAPVGDAGEEVVRYELWRVNLTNASLTPATAGAASGGGATATGSSLSSVLATRPSLSLAGAAARYGVTVHQPVLAAAARSGVGMSNVTQLQNPAGGLPMTATKVSSVDAKTVTNGTGVWLSEAASSLSWRNDYAYWVRTVDQDGLQSDSEPVDITPLKVRASAPGTPTSQWNQAECAVDLSWKVTDAETAGFVLEREIVSAPRQSGPIPTLAATSLTGSDSYVQISGITTATMSQYSDYTVFPDNNYVYRVRTVDKAGNVSVPAVVPTPVGVPDTCTAGTTARHVKNSPPANVDTPAVATPSVPANNAPKPADEITIPATRPDGSQPTGTQTGPSQSTPTPSAPSTTAPKPLDDIEIPATKPK